MTAELFRIFGSFALIPLPLNKFGVIGRLFFSLLVYYTFLDSLNFQLPITLSRVFQELMIGFWISFCHLLPFYIFIAAYEMIENIRGMNYSFYFSGIDVAEHQQMLKKVTIIILAVLIEQGLIENILQSLIQSYRVNVIWQFLTVLPIIEFSLHALTLGCRILTSLAMVMIAINVCSIFLAKLFPAYSFSAELFIAKMIIVYLIWRAA